MKTKILALIACVLMSGTAGAIVNSGNTAATPDESTTTSTVSVDSQTASTQAEAGTVQVTSAAPAANTQEISSNTVADIVKSNTSSVCPKTSASNGTVAGTNTTNCKVGSNCSSSPICSDGNGCTNKSNCTAGTSCTVKSNCLTSVNSANGTKYQITIGGKTYSCPNTSSSSNTASKPTSSSSSQGSTSSTPASTGGSYSSFQDQVVQLVNQERAANGLKALTVNSSLTKTATLKSEDMAKLNYFDHQSPTYGSPFDMMKQYGISYRSAGENIAMGQTTPQQVMQGWMNSSGHRANILNSSFTQIGVGIAKNAQGQYIWTQQFIG
nr:CAP domain-containing protein [uncultured Caproiciproducens sp.]